MAEPRWVLVIEDDRTIQLVLCRLLDEMGLSYRTAANPDEMTAAIEASDTDPALVLLDAVLPTPMDHGAFARALQGHFSYPAPILLVSALHPVQLAAVAESIGAYAFLAKPFDLDDLMVHVQMGLELSAPDNQPGG